MTHSPIAIYLVRHGQTWFNTTHQIQGFCDSPLTVLGEKQAIQLGKKLSDITFTNAYTSDLGRQRKTLQLLLDENHNANPKQKEMFGFREKNFGGFEGLPGDMMIQQLLSSMNLEVNETGEGLWVYLNSTLGEKQLMDKIAEIDPTHTAENWEQLLTRSRLTMEQMIEDVLASKGDTVLIVSSGGIIPVILESIAPGVYHGQRIENCSVTTLQYQDSQFIVKSIGQTINT